MKMKYHENSTYFLLNFEKFLTTQVIQEPKIIPVKLQPKFKVTVSLSDMAFIQIALDVY